MSVLCNILFIHSFLSIIVYAGQFRLIVVHSCPLWSNFSIWLMLGTNLYHHLPFCNLNFIGPIYNNLSCKKSLFTPKYCRQKNRQQCSVTFDAEDLYIAHCSRTRAAVGISPDVGSKSDIDTFPRGERGDQIHVRMFG
jgi:hypothetical protein